jgi:hypothetical protein
LALSASGTSTVQDPGSSAVFSQATWAAASSGVGVSRTFLSAAMASCWFLSSTDWGVVGDGNALVAVADRAFLDVGEEGREAVEVLRGEGIELVVVALGAAERRAHPDARGVADAVGGGLRLVLPGLRAALFGREVELVVARRDLRPQRRVRQQVSRELLHREAVEGDVLVEGR